MTKGWEWQRIAELNALGKMTFRMIVSVRKLGPKICLMN